MRQGIFVLRDPGLEPPFPIPDACLEARLPEGSEVLFAAVTGSRLYGTSTPQSDIDVRGIALPPAPYHLGFAHTFEQFENKTNDTVVYSLKKFFTLAVDCNPNITELLFVPEEMSLLAGPVWREIQRNRTLFLSQRARYRFAGYATAQLHRIKTHRKWLLEPPEQKPERSDFGLPNERLIAKDQVGAFNLVLARRLEKIRRSHPLKDQLLAMEETEDLLGAIQSAQPLEGPVIEALVDMPIEMRRSLARELEYDAAKKKWDAYRAWLRTRNEERLELERRYGYDTKHAMHLFRLMREGLELLRDHRITLPRPDADELLAIRDGALPFDEVEEAADRLDAEFEVAMAESTLPKAPPLDELDQLYMSTVKSFLEQRESGS